MRQECYDDLLLTLAQKSWKKIGVKKRAGVAVPLFSLFSSKSLGIGELPDLKLLGDWCKTAGMSIIQLLPINDVGYNFTPYDAESTFALDVSAYSKTDTG
jgi:4-alpha-glucanotransferase